MDNVNHGLKIEPIAPEEYTFGVQLAAEELQPDGQWDDYLPGVEIQKLRGVETSSCVSFGTLNCVEILYQRLYNQQKNYSERYTAILADTTRSGTSPTKVAEVIRKRGVIDDPLLPFSGDISSFEEYHSPKPMLQGFLDKGSEWLKTHEFGHDWVFTGGSVSFKQNLLKTALKSSPMGVSVLAWQKSGDYYTKPHGAVDNHWCTLYGYKDGEYWKIFDHYDDTNKKLAWDYDFNLAKRYTLFKQPRRDPYLWVLWRKILNLLGL